MSCADSDDDYAASMMSTSEVSGQSSENPSRKRKSTRGNEFRAWSFRLTVKADLGSGATAEEKGKLLTGHLNTSTGHTMPPSVTSVAVFCDESLFSVPPDSAGLVSIAVQGYVQASHVKPPSTMEKWINSATWEPVPGGLTSNHEVE